MPSMSTSFYSSEHSTMLPKYTIPCHKYMQHTFQAATCHGDGNQAVYWEVMVTASPNVIMAKSLSAEILFIFNSISETGIKQ